MKEFQQAYQQIAREVLFVTKRTKQCCQLSRRGGPEYALCVSVMPTKRILKSANQKAYILHFEATAKILLVSSTDTHYTNSGNPHSGATV